MSAQMKSASGTSRRARPSWTSLKSTPVTWCPAAASDRATGTPQPQPRSSTSEPGTSRASSSRVHPRYSAGAPSSAR
jgi:hypothetical protein